MNWQQPLNEIINFILYPEFTGWLLAVKLTFLGFGFFFFGYTIWALLKTSWLKKAIILDLKEYFSYRPFYAKVFASKWKKIEKRVKSGLESDLKLAILEADELLKECLDKVGYVGETIEEKIEKLSEEIISNLKDLKIAHQTRNDIIHDPSYKLSFDEAQKVLEIYKKTLEDLQAI